MLRDRQAKGRLREGAVLAMEQWWLRLLTWDCFKCLVHWSEVLTDSWDTQVQDLRVTLAAESRRLMES